MKKSVRTHQIKEVVSKVLKRLIEILFKRYLLFLLLLRWWGRQQYLGGNSESAEATFSTLLKLCYSILVLVSVPVFIAFVYAKYKRNCMKDQSPKFQSIEPSGSNCGFRYSLSTGIKILTNKV